MLTSYHKGYRGGENIQGVVVGRELFFQQPWPITSLTQLTLLTKWPL